MSKRGRPTIYTVAIADAVLDGIAEGKSLVEVCKADKMPSVRTIMQWAADNEEFSQRYVRAREAQAEFMDYEIIEAAKGADKDPQAARVKVDAFKWRAAKLSPKKYGDAMLHKHADADGEKIPLDETSKLTRLAAIVAQVQKLANDEPSDDAG